jgi:L-ribulokinase
MRMKDGRQSAFSLPLRALLQNSAPMKPSRSRTPRETQYVIGLDFGTLSARAILVEVKTGREVATAIHEYADGVIERNLPGSKKPLPPETALQNPDDYLKALPATIPKILRATKVQPHQVIGIGTDFTCCTILPTTSDGTPLSLKKEWRKNPHAWVKLWKHHAAQPEANRINELGHKRGEVFVKTYGGKYSSEWFFSKLLETVRAAPEVYKAADRFIEAGDWIVWQLCGQEKRSLSAAGFKAMWVYPDNSKGWTYPDTEFFKALHPKLENVVREKLSVPMHPLGTRAGGLTPKMAEATGLLQGTAIAVGNIDAHAAVPACTVTSPGKLVMIIGTSTCHLLLDEKKRPVEGICGVVQDGVVSGLWGYEAGQAGVGDLFAWYVEHAAPTALAAEAAKKRQTVHQLLEDQAAHLRPGESGLSPWIGSTAIVPCWSMPT